MTSAQTVAVRWLEAHRGPNWTPRESYLPPKARGTDPLLPEGTDLAIWKYEDVGSAGVVRPYAIAFAGKQSKPLWHHVFRTEDQRENEINETISARKRTLEYKNKIQQERNEFKHEFNVGDILVSSWGYDQTNVDFYEVVSILGPSMVGIREIGKKVVKTEQTTDYVVAVPGSYDGPTLRKKVSPGHRVRITSYASASKWDGKPQYQTAFGYGH